MSKILRFEQLPKDVQKKLASKDWYTFQQNVRGYAEEYGYAGFTKPYKSTNPLAKQYEFIIFDKRAIKPKEILEPSGYGLKPGTKKEVINIVTVKEQMQNIPGLSDKPFGKDWPSATVKFGIGRRKEKLRTYTAAYQAVAKAKATSGIITRNVLEEAANLTAADRDAMMGGHLIIKGSKGHRYAKDIIDEYMLMYKGVQHLVKKGDLAAARKSVADIIATREYYKTVDFIAGAKAYKQTLAEIIPPKSQKEPLRSKIVGSAQASTGRGSAYVGITSTQQKPSPTQQPSPKPSVRSPISPRSILLSVPSVKSILSGSSLNASARSALSPKSGSPRPSISAKSAASVSSMRSAGVSPRSALASSSALSPKSVLSPKSGSAFSPRSPSPASPKSPTSPLSPKSPVSPKSPLSPKSPISPLSPLSPPSPLFPKSPLRPSRTVIPMWWAKEKKRKADLEKERADFLGSTRVAQITGFRTTKTDITYGRSLTEKLALADIKKTGKRYGMFSKGKGGSLLAKSKPSFRKETKYKVPRF
jgi:hypothetical protein